MGRRPSRLRPLLAAVLGLLSLSSAWGQLHPTTQASPTAAEPMATSLPAPALTPPAKVLEPSPAAQRNILATISSTAAGGNWSAPATWAGGVVPTASDNVTIVAGATVTLNVAAATSALTIASGGTLTTSATTAYVLQVGGSLTNNGTLTLSANTTLGSDLRFVGAGSVTFGGTGTTDLYSMSLAKAVLADMVDMNLPSLSVKGAAGSPTGFLFTRTTGTTPADDMVGTLKLSGTAAITNRVFGNAAAYIIPATGAFWLSNANYTVAAQTGSPTVNGQLRISAGTFNVGTSSGNSILFTAASVYTQEGGTLNAAGRFGSFTAAAASPVIVFNMSGGTLNVSTVGNASGTPSFGVNGTNNVSGGTINLVQRSTATTPLDYYVAGTYSFTGGTLSVGTTATATNFDFRIRGSMPNLIIDNTTNNKSAVLQGQTNVFGTATIPVGAALNLNGNLLLLVGSAITNNGTLTGTTANSTLYFQGSAPQTLGGSGTFTTLRTLSLDNNGGGVTLTVPLVVTRVNMFTGNLNGTTNLTVGDGSLTVFVIQTGVAGNTGTSGSLTSAPTFNIGTGALSLIYALETTARTTGFEIPSTRVVDALSLSNPNGLTLAGGNLTINTSAVTTGTLTLTSGILTTSAANVLTIGTGATTFPTGSAASYVRGPLGITVNSATAVSRTFAVGDAAGWRPVVVSAITTSSAQTFTATVVNGATGGSLMGTLSSLNPTRYVRLQNSASLPATARVQLAYGADDVVGAPATAVVAQAPTAGGAYASLGGATATTPTTSIISTQDLTPGNDFFVLANTEGGTLATSTASGCAGSTSGTLTLSGNAAGSTVVKYQFDNGDGSGYQDVAGTNTGTTLTFTNLTVTTTFRAVVLTSDNRTVFSAPVTVTVLPQTTATFSYSGSPFCKSNATNPTPNVTGTAGGTFTASPAGLTINATTGVITLSSSAAGTYTVTYSVGGPCPSSSTQSVTITATPVATFSYAGSPYCKSSPTNPTVTLGTGATAGTFTATPAGLTLNATTGEITLSSSAAGTYTVTNTIAASGGCAQTTATASVTITAAPLATFSYAGSPYCKSSPTNPTVTLGAGATAGTFTATPAGLTLNATTGAITLSSSTAGTYTVTNTVAASGGCAQTTATASVTITAAPAAGFSYPTPGTGAACAGGTGTFAPTLASGATAGTFTAVPTGLSLNATTGVITLSGSAAGSYTITNTVAASGGCAATSGTASFTVNPVPATPTLSASGTPGTGITLTSSSATGNQFYRDGILVSGATGQTYLINSGTRNGSYTVVVTGAGGRASASSAAVVVAVTASAPAQAATSLTLYPNPTPDGHLTVELTGYHEAVQLTISNALGQRVYETTLAAATLAHPQALNLSALPGGVYVLQARTASGGVEVRRLVRE